MRLLSAFAALSLFPLTAADPWIGRWKMDPARSQFPGQPPTNVVYAYEPRENGFHFTSSGLLQDGTPYQYGFDCAPGKSGCKVENYGNFDSVAVEWKNGILETRFYSRGRLGITHRARFSADGKTMTNESVFQRPDGTTFQTRAHFDRQGE